VVQVGWDTAQASSRPLCHPHDVDFVGMQKIIGMGSWSFHPDFKGRSGRLANVWQ
jgi:hypothetical protein